MATRPEDYGDQHPSDLDDTAPADPTAGYGEVDYEIASQEGKELDAENPSDVAADPGVPLDRAAPIRGWAAIVLEAVDPADPMFLPDAPTPQFWCLRQDGKRVAAYCLTLEEYEQYNIGHDVLIRSDQAQPWDGEAVNHWIMVGKSRPQELPIVDAYLTADTACTTLPFIVPFNQTKEKLPIDDTFGGFDEVKFAPGVLTAGKTDDALYHIELSVTVECCNPDPPVDFVYSEHGCWNEPDLEDIGQVRTPKLWFNRENGFKVLWDPDDCTGKVSIGSDCQDSVLNQRYVRGIEPAFWTDSPRFGGSVSIGTQRGTAYAKIGNDNTYVWLTHGNGKLKFRFPPNGPVGVPAFLIASGGGDECVQTNWMAPGGSGTISALDCVPYDYEYCYITVAEDDIQYCARPLHACHTWQVCNGLIVSGPGIVNIHESSPCFYPIDLAYCPLDKPCDDHPCP